MKQALLVSALIACASSTSYATTTTVIPNVNTISTVGKQDPATNPGEATAEKAETSNLTGNFDITTNYVFRGVSNSNNNPAFQGGLTYTVPVGGIYFNVWGSNVDFLDPQGRSATVEADTIVGIANNINDNWSYNINFDRYNYPKATASNYNEFIAALTYKLFTVTIGESLNVYGSHDSGTYYNALVNVPIPYQYALHLNNVSAEASIGHYSLPHDAGLYSYNDYMVGIAKAFGMYDFLVQYTNTNHRTSSPGLDTGTLIATLTANF